MTTRRIEIQDIADAALEAIDQLLADWLPDGKRTGKEYWPINPVRGDRSPGSFSINMHTGTWYDFASGDKGGDLVSLLAYLHGSRQWEAAKAIAHQLGIPMDDDTPATDRDAERQRIAREREQRLHQRQAEQQQRQQQAATKARRLWLGDSQPADSNHPYLTNKRIKPHDLRQQGNALLIPLVHGGRLVNVQRIRSDGQKRFLPGGRVKGCYSPIGELQPGQPLYICEGWATGATIHEHTGAAVACAMNAGNLLEVGKYLQRTIPDTLLIVAGDDDRQTKGNPGRTAAIHAAAMLGCGMVMPPWSGQEPPELSDFNDLHCWRACA